MQNDFFLRAAAHPLTALSHRIKLTWRDGKHQHQRAHANRPTGVAAVALHSKGVRTAVFCQIEAHDCQQRNDEHRNKQPLIPKNMRFRQQKLVLHQRYFARVGQNAGAKQQIAFARQRRHNRIVAVKRHREQIDNWIQRQNQHDPDKQMRGGGQRVLTRLGFAAPATPQIC